MNKIQKVSRCLVYCVNVLLVVVSLGVCLRWLFVDSALVKSLMHVGLLENFMRTPEGVRSLLDLHWTSGAKALMLLAGIIRVAPLVGALCLLRCLFGSYQRGVVFSQSNALRYGRLGQCFLLDALVAQPISHTLNILGLTLMNEPGHRYLSLAFGTLNLEMLFCGVCIVVISWVMREASHMEDEYQLTV